MSILCSKLCINAVLVVHVKQTIHIVVPDILHVISSDLLNYKINANFDHASALVPVLLAVHTTVLEPSAALLPYSMHL